MLHVCEYSTKNKISMSMSMSIEICLCILHGQGFEIFSVYSAYLSCYRHFYFWLKLIRWLLSFQGDTSVVVLFVLCFGVEVLCCLDLMYVYIGVGY